MSEFIVFAVVVTCFSLGLFIGSWVELRKHPKRLALPLKKGRAFFGGSKRR